MDIEQLKLILAALEKAGDGAFFIALLHFGHPYVTTLCLTVFGTVAVLALRRLLTSIVTSCSMGGQMESWAKDLGIRVSGYSHTQSKEQAQVISAINKLIAEAKANGK